MAHRSGDVAVVRSVGGPLAEDGQKSTLVANEDDTSAADNDEDGDLPQCKIKRNYHCNLCSFFSQNPRSFLYHSRDVHFDRIKIYECSQCLYASKHSQKLQRHINMIHVNGKNRGKKPAKQVKQPEKKKIERPIKPKAVEIAAPIPIIYPPVIEESQGNDMSSIPFDDCDDDDDQYVDEEELLDKELKCSMCNFTNRSPSLMRRHERVVHLKKRFLRCNKCSYVTHVKARYTKHVKYHSMPMIKCDLCDFRTPYKWNLDRHYKNHCGSGAFQCSKCNFRADIKQSLTVHEMNHHIPPVGQGAVMARRRNKVGGSEAIGLESDGIDKDELELLQMEKDDSQAAGNDEIDKDEVEPQRTERRTGKRNTQNLRNMKLSYRRESVNNNLQTDFIHPDDIVPRYGQIYVKTLKCKFCSYKAVFSHELWRHEKRIHDYVRRESKKEKVPGRPPPKLIPLQSKTTPTPPSSPILKIPAVRNKNSASDANVSEPSSPGDKSVNEKEFTEMCKKSCLTSSLKDFVSLIGDEEGLKTIPDSQGDIDLECKSWTESCDEGDAKNSEEANKKKQTDLLKKKNASFFDKLKEKLLTSSSENSNLICDFCGHESKCLSEAVAHQKRHTNGSRSDSEGHPENDIILTGAELSSTRCQHCRQRCKTSTDLINHLKSCKAFGAAYDQQPKLEDDLDIPIKTEDDTFNDENTNMEEDNNSMENRVFVWNPLPQMQDLDEDEEMEDMDAEMPGAEEDMDADFQMYGTVTNKGVDNTESGTLVAEIDPRLSLTVKKVFKCPHCSFWASTASRFHVHIVGHLNKKPFECSLCMYRSNWRWDITKHIRLKSARDPSHLEAKVNMTDETGRRNYSKYNKYLTMMKVQEPSAESSGTGRRSKACDATQGTVAENDIIPLPAPPRLIRAPTPGNAYQIPQGAPLRPPPPLKAAHPVITSPSTKKTLWKCKKCNFRDSSKDLVLAHVKEHYGMKSTPAESQNQEDAAEDGKTAEQTGSAELMHKTPPFRCGHCHQVSNWKHVIQRHCRLKHNGFVLIELDWKDGESGSKQSLDPSTSLDNSDTMVESLDTFSCDICPFTTDSEGDLTAHKLNHVDRPGSIFKCIYCPFYVPSKIAVLEHMEVHGVECSSQLASLKFDSFEPSDCNEAFLKNKTNDSNQAKRFKCRQCPYVSNSKTQFLYHKQFHRPRQAPFKCMYCTYNVSRRHLLHQHLKVHDSTKERKSRDQSPSNSNSPVDPIPAVDIDTSDMPEIPLAWVFKSGKFHKMFKCRWCPHVNVRKINIQEHEKMHRPEGKGNSNSSQSSFKLQCTECNYMCNNAGVLSSHVKVHQGFYGEIRSLVDPTKSDAEQIQALQSALRIVEPEVLIRVEADSDNEEQERNFRDLSPPLESIYNQRTKPEQLYDFVDENRKVISFCRKCPARFFLKRELRIHSKFHLIRSPFKCPYCSYTARQRPHLLSHYKVHCQEYQRRTEELVNSYAISSDNPRRKTVIISKHSPVIDGPVWMLENYPNDKLKADGKAKAKYACNRCPAKFFKAVTLHYHLSLHGGSDQHKCKYCDYAVKTYGNLMRHQLVHEESQKKSNLKNRNTPESARKSEQTDGGTKSKCDKKEDPNKKKLDPQFGNLVNGSPDFIYPTYCKNGKVKEKRYKCHKCPSAFEKREQYKIHVSLHGSKQKYRCPKCDYSVKYYANYAQHMRKHQFHDEAMEARKSGYFEDGQDSMYATAQASPDACEDKTLEQSYPLTLLEQQTLLLQEMKKQSTKEENEKRVFGCSYCPYVSNRRDAVDNHAKRHYSITGVRSTFQCMHCDYSASQANFLREHNKLHFNKSSRHKAEAYLKCENLELWCVEDKDRDDPISEMRTLVFKDKGEKCEDRFFPPVPDQFYQNSDDDWRMYVDPDTGELIEEVEPSIENDTPMEFESDDPLPSQLESGEIRNDLVDMEEQLDEIPQKDVVKPKVKRLRGKNWKCKKCPHKFGKKDQYLRHVNLHGSNQRYSCDICDYSVRYYVNYVQHMRMHQFNEPDRIVYIKKIDEDSEVKALKVAQDTETNPDMELFIKDDGDVAEYESDSAASHADEKMAVEQAEYSDQEYSSLTDGTVVSISSEDGIRENSVEAEVSVYVNDDNVSSVIS